MNCIKITLKIPGESQLEFFRSSKQTNKGNSSYCFSALLKIAKKFPRDVKFNNTWEYNWRLIYTFKLQQHHARWRLGAELVIYLGWVKVTSRVYARKRKLSLVTNQLFTRAPTLPRPHMTRVSCLVTRHNLLCEGRKKLGGN